MRIAYSFQGVIASFFESKSLSIIRLAVARRSGGAVHRHATPLRNAVITIQPSQTVKMKAQDALIIKNISFISLPNVHGFDPLVF